MTTATGTIKDDDAERILRDRRGMRLVARSERKKSESGLRIGIANDVFIKTTRRVPLENSDGKIDAAGSEGKPESSNPISSGAAKNLALAAAVGLIVGLLLSRRD